MSQPPVLGPMGQAWADLAEACDELLRIIVRSPAGIVVREMAYAVLRLLPR